MAPICWKCGEKGHLRRMCPASLQGKSSRKSPSPVYPTLNMVSRSATITVQGFLFDIPVRMLVDTGFAVIIVCESVCKKTDREPTIEEAPTSPIVTANGNPLSPLIPAYVHAST